MTDSTFQQIVSAQGGLTRQQKAKLEDRDIRECKNCKGADCELCGGSGVRKKCNSRQCVEHGCSGYGDYEVTSQEITELLVAKYRLLQYEEVIKLGDQYLTDDAETWDDVKGWPIGMKWKPYAFQPVRRAL